jgi:hypothetical protein
MKFRGGEFSTGTMGNFQPELTLLLGKLFLRMGPDNFGRVRRIRADGD